MTPTLQACVRPEGRKRASRWRRIHRDPTGCASGPGESTAFSEQDVGERRYAAIGNPSRLRPPDADVVRSRVEVRIHSFGRRVRISHGHHGIDQTVVPHQRGPIR